jgi:histidinol-phosphate aminotransferase
MTMKSSVTRRRFLRMSSSLPVGAALLPGLASSAFAAPSSPAAGASASAHPSAPPDVAILNGNEYFAGPTPAAVEGMHKVALIGNRYLNDDTSEFSKQVAAYHDLKPNYVTLYAGSAEPLRYATMAFTSPTRSLVTADPVYESAWGAAAGVGTAVHRVPLKADSTYDMKAMLAADPNAGLFYICNPSNPTGVNVKRSEIEWLLASKPAGSVLLVDEAYIHFSDAESVIDLVAKDRDLVVIRSFSKIYSMAGLRFGYAMARPDLMAKLRVYGVNHVPTTSVQCAKAQLEDKQLVPSRKEAMTDQRNRTFDWLTKNGYAFTPSDCNHFMVDVRRPGAAVANAMAHKQVIIGRTWAIWPNFSRITIGSPAEMQRFQVALLEVMQMPAEKMTALPHPYPRILRAQVC